jgi:hypothetical protein
MFAVFQKVLIFGGVGVYMVHSSVKECHCLSLKVVEASSSLRGPLTQTDQLLIHTLIQDKLLVMQ